MLAYLGWLLFTAIWLPCTLVNNLCWAWCHSEWHRPYAKLEN